MSGEQLEPGTLLNERYRILRVIGKGGMGTVYMAEHVRLDTILAVKEVRAPQTADIDAQSLLEQCEHEARFLVRLHHPNLPTVTDAFLEDDRFFVVMEYIEGVTLEAKERLARPEGLPVGTVIEWALQISDVLAYLHSQDPPIIFRDLKPANVMVDASARIRLIDFGIARRFQPGAVKDTNLLGSVGYSPPEQFGRHQTDTRTDIYAFGATLHNLLTGRDPSHSPFKFTPVCTLNPSVPESLSRLIDCCLRLDADARPQTIHEIAVELLTIRDTLPAPVAVPPGAADPAVEPSGKPVEATSPPSGGANIILTNPSLRNSGKTQRGSHRTGSGSTRSDKLGIPGTGRSPSGSTNGAAPANGESAATSGSLSRAEMGAGRLWLGGITAVAVLSGLTVWMLYANAKHTGARHNPPAHNLQTPAALVPNQDSVHPQQAPPVVTPETAPPAAPSDTGSVPMTTLNRTVTFDSIVVRDVTQDPQGHSSLRIQVTGSAEGQIGDQETIAAFFYDTQNNQITSQLPQTPYSSKDGKLSAATTLSLITTHMPFDLALDIPLSAFPANLTGGAQFHCVAFYGDQRIGESKTYTPVSANVLAPSTGSQQIPGAPPPDPGGGAPTTPATPRPGAFGSSPVTGD